jgi:hypothetical protein
MSLVFSLSAALLATLVQQWVRDYMHVFLRYNDPLKSARLRQYLHEGLEGWYMPLVAEAVPGLIHVALFLFFAGLCDLVLNINTTLGVSTIVPIGISGLLYVVTIIAPLIYPQSPYKNSLSALIWYLIQKIRVRRYQGQGSSKALAHGSLNISERQLKLAMDVTDERKQRDERALRWLVDGLNKDAEMDLFVAAIPGSFHTYWGVDVWKGVSEAIQDENMSATRNGLAVRPLPGAITMPQVIDTHPPRIRTIRNPITSLSRRVTTRAAGASPSDSLPLLPIAYPPDVPLHDITAHTQPQHAVHELSLRIAQLLETCKNRGLFASDELWRKSTRACVETTTSLVFFTDADLNWFGDIGKLLGEIGAVEKTRESSLSGMDQLFVTRWTCLSLLVIRPILDGNTELRYFATIAVESFSQFENEDGTDDEQAEKNAQKLDEMFERAWTCLWDLSYALSAHDKPTAEQMQDILRDHEEQIMKLEQINTDADRMEDIDQRICSLRHRVPHYTHGIVRQLPGVEFEDFPLKRAPFNEDLGPFVDPLTLQFIPPQSSLKGAYSLYSRFRDALSTAEFEETLKSLKAFTTAPHWQNNLLSRQPWRLQDLRDGGGFGFTVELFFLSLKQLLSNTLSHDPHAALFVHTFRAITSDWHKYKDSLGTQKVLLAVTAPSSGIIVKFNLPPDILNQFLVLLENVFKGKEGPHIDKAVQDLTEYQLSHDTPEFYSKLLKIISQPQTTPL